MDTKTKNDDDIRPLSPEEIKAIGEIEIGPSKHEVFLNAHYKKLMWGGIGFSLLAGCVIAYFSYRNDHRTAAAAELMQAFKVTAPGMVAAPVDYDKAALDNLASAYSATPSAAASELLRGLSMLEGDKPQEGVTILQNVVTGSENPLLAARAQAALAGYYMSDGKDAEATAAWQKLVQMGDSPYVALGYLTLGDMAATAGDKEAARGYYEQARTKCETSSLVTSKVVEMRLLLLDVDAPKPVAPPAAEEQRNAVDPLNPFGDTAETPAASGSADVFNATPPAQSGEGPLGPVTPAL